MRSITGDTPRLDIFQKDSSPSVPCSARGSRNTISRNDGSMPVRRRSIKYTYARRNKHNSESRRGRGAHDIINRLYTESVMREIAKPGIQRSARLDNGR